MHLQKPLENADPWYLLRAHTPARIALGRTGFSLPLKQQQNLKVAHALARDAVYAELNKNFLFEGLAKTGLPFGFFKSMAADRQHYLLRPDLGRRLSAESRAELERIRFDRTDLQIVMADGLAADAVHRHGLQLLEYLLEKATAQGLSLAPIAVVEQGRVAVADEIGELCSARITVMLLGERPGLSAADSLGAYISFGPRPGKSDAERNCVSNIRIDGLSYEKAAEQIIAICQTALNLGYTGVEPSRTLPKK